MATQASSATTRGAAGSVWRGGLIALVASLVVNHIIRLIAVALLNPDPGFVPLTTWAPVTMFTIIGVVGATIVYALLRRFTANPNRIFTTVAIVVFVVMLIPDIIFALNPAASMAPGTTPGTMAALALMHIPTAYFCWRFLTGGRAA